MNDGPHTPEDDLDFGQTVRGLSPGQCLFQRYRLRSVLGRGGMGVVWLADDEQLDCPVALKFLPEIVTHDRQAIADLKREVIKSRALNHHHIVRVHDFVTDGVAAAISMEYVDGGTLSDLRLDQPGGVFEPEALLPWVEQLCSALTYAHGTARLVHRDLKPKNLMITSKGELKVADFGISRSITESASMGSLAHSSSGSPPYMSPQQIAGESPSPADDIYAVGATLYELLTGRPPFYRGGALAIMDQVKTKIPERVNERRRANDIPGEVPAHWEETIAACLAKAPAARPASAGEVWERLSGMRQVIQPVPQAVATVVATPVAVTPAPVPQFDQAAVPKVIKFECPHCGQRISATAKEQGQPGRCPECAKGFMVPREQGEAGMAKEKDPQEEQVKTAQVPEVAPSLPAAPEKAEKAEKVEIIWKSVPEDPQVPQVPEVTRSPHNKSVFVTTVILATALVGVAGWWFGIEQPKRAVIARAVNPKAEAEQRNLEEAEASRIAEEAHKKREVEDAAEKERLRLAKAKADAEELQRQLAAKALASATKNNPFINSLGMRFVPVPIVGGRTNGKRILFSVWDVRVKDFEAFVGESGYDMSQGEKLFSHRDGKYGHHGDTWRSPGFAQTALHPVVGVSWEDAKAFCSWLTKKERLAGNLTAHEEYRLPSDHEWSCAVGIGDREDAKASPKDKNGKIADEFVWDSSGTLWPPPKGAGNFGDESAKKAYPTWSSIEGYDDGYANTSPVGRFSANQHALYDMNGNVWGWCEDWYDSEQKYRVARGGSFVSYVRVDLLSSCRIRGAPSKRNFYIGFRVVVADSSSGR